MLLCKWTGIGEERLPEDAAVRPPVRRGPQRDAVSALPSALFRRRRQFEAGRR